MDDFHLFAQVVVAFCHVVGQVADQKTDSAEEDICDAGG